MLIKRPDDIKPSEITNPSLYANRREFLKGGAAVALGVALPAGTAFTAAYGAAKLGPLTPSEFNTDEETTPFKSVTTHNNFYEFGTDKESAAKLAKSLRPRPWTVLVDGEVKNPREWDIDDILKQFPLEERIYRLRCVEAWSMVVPWVGISLASFIKAVEPTSNAKYVAFETLVDPEQMPGQRSNLFGFGLDWPYIEGLRIDEATNPLAILGVGLYGEVMPNQNGAPIRLVVPWKYGFKSIKSIVRISFVEKQPVNTWQVQAPREYGFYANVNPQVDHPRWSQAQERRIGDWLKRKTLMFNGYGEQVAHLYSGMDLGKNF